MKRTFTTTLLTLLLCVCMVFGLTACGGFTQDDIDNAVNEATAPLNEQITALEADIAEKEAKIATLESEKTALTTEKGELEAEITALEAEKAALEAQITALNGTIDDKNAEIKDLNTSISDLNTEKEILTDRVSDLEEIITTMDMEIADLNSSIDILKDEKQALTDRVAELEGENEKLEAENSGLKNCLKDIHEYEDNVCKYCGELKFIDATNMTADELKAAVAEKLAAGETDIIVILAPDADDDKYPYDTSTMQYAIRSALNSSDVADGSVSLTIKGLKVVFVGFLGTYEYYDEEAQDYVEEAAVTKVRSITLTDATEIGLKAFMDCTSLETLSLTAEGEITLDEIFGDSSVSEQVQLILHANKRMDVSENTFAGYTFEAVAYTCADGTTAHSVGETVAYLWNEDYTICSAGTACTKCSYVDVKETVQATLEAVTENSTAHSAVFTNAAFETQTKTFGYIYDSVTNTYSVWDEEGLNIWRLAVAEDYATNLTLMDDITLSTEGITVDENGKPSTSNWTYVMRFSGTLDGGGHCIVNLRMYDKLKACFIRVVYGGTIKNLTFVNPVIYGEEPYIGTLAGQVSGGSSFIGCHVQGGSVTGEGNGTGGLIGTIVSDENYIYGCTNSAKVTGTKWVGGIIGDGSNTDNVLLAACANIGEVSGNSGVGGIVGNPRYEKLIACYTTVGNLCGNTYATVTGSYYVASADTDGEDGTTAVTDVNTAEVVDAMNAAIDTYNSSATVKVTYKWAVGENGVPVLVEAE